MNGPMNDTKNETLGDQSWGKSTPRDRRNHKRFLMIFCGALLASRAITVLFQGDHISAGPVRWIVACLPSLVLLWAGFAFFRFLREADELQRAVQLQALALALCAGIVVWPSVQLLEKAGVSYDFFVALSEIPILVMIVTYLLGLCWFPRRYR